MQHLVNVALLFFFMTLLTSGLVRFFQPFSLTVTRVHITFGFGLALLIFLHLSYRGKYFQRLLLRPRGKTRPAIPQVTAAFALWAYALIAALWNFWPVPQLIGVGYEVQHARDIFRPHERVAYIPVENGLHVHRGATADTGLRIEFDWGPEFGRNLGDLDLQQGQTQLALWAENEEGTVLETIFVSPRCAHAEAIDWGGQRLHRQDILPVWYARYKEMLGKWPETDVDGVSSATPVRDFSMDGHLKTDGLPFALYAEVNAPNDTNTFFNPNQQTSKENDTRPGVGQPSVVYEARIYPSDERQYYLMDLIGHSGNGEMPAGDVEYDLSTLSSAKNLVDKILIRVRWPDTIEQQGDTE